MASSPLFQGGLNVGRRGKFDLRHFVLRGDRLDGDLSLVYFSDKGDFEFGHAPRGRLMLADIDSCHVDGRLFKITFLGARELVLQAPTYEDMVGWYSVLKERITLVGEDPTRRSVLTLQRSSCEHDKAMLCLSLTNLAGEEVVSLEFNPHTETVKSFWKVVTDNVGQSKDAIAIIRPDASVVEDDDKLADILGCAVDRDNTSLLWQGGLDVVRQNDTKLWHGVFYQDRIELFTSDTDFENGHDSRSRLMLADIEGFQVEGKLLKIVVQGKDLVFRAWTDKVIMIWANYLKEINPHKLARGLLRGDT